ncbi:hypothetical protein H2198_001543 [Neophaeococcomyces mojaviensis]|uniref:Uncharacterized protein n=1 Tax=Neophaeococcomyces mojaviensis TaxID=3383035 RepID=A0ACC3AHQ4_9EURO|nr:hypothetical protein H2198_001543 [Knufia sp. JES_112]
MISLILLLVDLAAGRNVELVLLLNALFCPIVASIARIDFATGRKQPNRRGPQPGNRKRDFDIYQEDTDTAGFPIARTDLYPKGTRYLDAVNGSVQAASVLQQIVLKEITNFCEQHLPSTVWTQQAIDSYCGVIERTSQRWRSKQYATASHALAVGAIDKHPRADNARKTTDQQAIDLRQYCVDGEYSDVTQPWRYIAAAIGIPPRVEGGPTERTVRKVAHKDCVYDQLSVRKPQLEQRVAEMRKRTANFILGFDPDDIIFRQLRCSDESHEGMIKWSQDHQKRPLGFRDDERKIQRDLPRSYKQRKSRKGQQVIGKKLLDMEPRGPINGDSELRELVEQAVHFWGCVGVDHKSELYFYDKNSNGKMDNETYEKILRWYNEKYPRGALGTADDWILVEDRDGAHGGHGSGLFNEPEGVQTGDEWKGKGKGYNHITKVKHNLKIRWLVLPTGACDLNIIENCWLLLQQRLPSLAGLSKAEKREIIQDTWMNKGKPTYSSTDTNSCLRSSAQSRRWS